MWVRYLYLGTIILLEWFVYSRICTSINHVQSCGIELHVFCLGTPQQNGVAERKHRHIVETRLTISFHTNMPLSLWVEVFSIVVYLINRLPSLVLLNENPYQKLYKRNPDYNGLWVLGCLCFSSLQNQGGSKFVTKTYPCVFIGYSPIHKGYRCLEPKTKRVYISRHVVFEKKHFPLTPLNYLKILKNWVYLNFKFGQMDWQNWRLTQNPFK